VAVGRAQSAAGVAVLLWLMVRVEVSERGQFAGDVREGQHNAMIARSVVGVLLGCCYIETLMAVMATARSSSSESCHLVAFRVAVSSPDCNCKVLRAVVGLPTTSPIAGQADELPVGLRSSVPVEVPPVGSAAEGPGPDGARPIKFGQG
jgi:hypothetical protein